MSSTIDFFEIEVKCAHCGHENEVSVTRDQDNRSCEVNYSHSKTECEECGGELNLDGDYDA